MLPPLSGCDEAGRRRRSPRCRPMWPRCSWAATGGYGRVVRREAAAAGERVDVWRGELPMISTGVVLHPDPDHMGEGRGRPRLDPQPLPAAPAGNTIVAPVIAMVNAATNVAARSLLFILLFLTAPTLDQLAFPPCSALVALAAMSRELLGRRSIRPWTGKRSGQSRNVMKASSRIVQLPRSSPTGSPVVRAGDGERYDGMQVVAGGGDGEAPGASDP